MKIYLLISLVLIIQTIVSVAQPIQDTTRTKINNPNKQSEVKWVNPDIKEIPGLKHHILQSKSLGHEVGYVVWTPAGYSVKASKRYPVIYFLHGIGGNESADAAGFSGMVAKAIADKILPPVICVFPNGGISGYRGEVEKMMIEELIPTIDTSFKTIAKSKSRALAGFSMGGSGSVYLAMMYPELFCAAGSMGGGMGGRSAKAENANELAAFIDKAIPVWKKNNFGFFLVNGEYDHPDAFTEFAKTLNKEGIDHEVLILPDTKHNLGHYYERSANKLLAFIARHLKK